MTDETVQAIAARAEAATPGPWRISGEETVYSDDETMEWAAEATDDDDIPAYPPERHTADAAFIAHAREDIPALLAEMKRRTAIAQTLISLTQNIIAALPTNIREKMMPTLAQIEEVLTTEEEDSQRNR